MHILVVKMDNPGHTHPLTHTHSHTHTHTHTHILGSQGYLSISKKTQRLF